MKINFPTLLTITRIILTVPMMICIFIESDAARIAAIICFIIASASDFIDGRLARKYHKVTKLGKFLDPLADKMLVNLAFLALVVLGAVPVWVFGIIIVRDLMVDGVRMMAASNKVTIDASKFGKAKTMLQMITLALIMLNLIIQNDILSAINMTLLGFVVILTVYSGFDYLIKAWKYLE